MWCFVFVRLSLIYTLIPPCGVFAIAGHHLMEVTDKYAYYK